MKKIKKFTGIALAGAIGLSGLGLIGVTEASAAQISGSGSGTHQSTIKYDIVVKTGTETNAGTDANVTLTIYGENGSESFTLANGQDNFEKGDEDRFSLYGKDVGKIKKINLYQDGSGNKPGWQVEWIKINGLHIGINAWLGDSSSGSFEKSL